MIRSTTAFGNGIGRPHMSFPGLGSIDAAGLPVSHLHRNRGDLFV